MSNEAAGAYGLTLLSPIRNGIIPQRKIAFDDETRDRCAAIPLDEHSPFARVPNTYTARLFVLRDVLYESTPAADRIFNFNDVLSLFSDRYRLRNLPRVDRLKSSYLVFNCYFHGALETWLEGLWSHWRVEDGGRQRGVDYIWEHCVAFDQVKSQADFVNYIKRCQVDFSLLFNGSNGESLREQLKGLYLKETFTRFVAQQQGKSAAEIQQAYREFSKNVKINDLDGPTWPPGLSSSQGADPAQ